MNALNDLYQQVIIDHSRERHGYGLVADADAESFQLNPTCGDEIRLQINIRGQEITSVRWEGRGCSISQASASVLTDLIEGGDFDQADALAATFRELMHARHEPLAAQKLDALGDAAAFAGVARYPARVKCAMLGWVAFADALATARRTTTTTNDRSTP